ncbi:hypothetical protein C0991_006365, partial [Blastosporella zonata]
MDTISDKLALVNINVKEWLESRAAWGFCGHFEDAVENAEDDLRSFQRRLSTKQMRQDVFDVPVDIEDAIWKGRVVVDDDKFRRLVKGGDPVQFLLQAWITLKEWLESRAAWGFCGHFEDAVENAEDDLRSFQRRLSTKQMRQDVFDVPVDIEDAIWKEKVVVDDDNFRRLVKRGDPLQFLLNAWIT